MTAMQRGCWLSSMPEVIARVERRPPMSSNPRSANGNFRRKMRQRFKARGDQCGICRGRLGPIDYAAPSDSDHPLSFVIDEIRPVSRWREFGYESAAAAAQDVDNLQAAHWVCNAGKGARVSGGGSGAEIHVNIADGSW